MELGAVTNMHTVFLVDDDQLVIEQLWEKRGLFMECGFEIAGAETNPITALEKIRALRPDVVLSDLKMPGFTGIELLEELRRDLLPPILVIISAYGDFKDVRKLFLSYGFDYLLKPVSDVTLTDLMNRLAARIDYTQPKAEGQTPSRELNQILLYLKEYLAMKHSLESIGERYNINPNTVCNLFAKHLGTTFTAYLTSIRMERADELLLSTDKPVKEIAAESGYSDYFYFCRVFRERHGMSPTHFREKAYEQ